MLSFMNTWVSLWNVQKSLCCTLKHLKTNLLVAKLSNFCVSLSSIDFSPGHPEQELY